MKRRDVLRGLVGLCAGCAGRAPTGFDGCTAPSAGGGETYCLVNGMSARVAGGASLAVGEVLLANIDDNTAVLVGRDDAGFFARSAVCTHACCIVALCGDDGCSTLDTTPDPCAVTGAARSDRVLCPCHGSTFRISDGEALTGPASTPLPAYPVSVDGADLWVDTGAAALWSDRTPA